MAWLGVEEGSEALDLLDEDGCQNIIVGVHGFDLPMRHDSDCL
jgi:hypothetical protein